MSSGVALCGSYRISKYFLFPTPHINYCIPKRSSLKTSLCIELLLYILIMHKNNERIFVVRKNEKIPYFSNFKTLQEFMILIIIKDLMNMQGEAVDQEFVRQIKYVTKDDENRFVIKYILSSNEKNEVERKKSPSPMKKQSNKKNLPDKKPPAKNHQIKPFGKEEEVIKPQQKKWKKSKVNYVDWDETNFEDFQQYNKINRKKMKLLQDFKAVEKMEKKEKKKKRKQERREKKWKKNQNFNQEDLEEVYEKGFFKENRARSIQDDRQWMKSEEKRDKKFKANFSKKKKELFQPYIDIQDIEESRQIGENRYFKGIVDFNERIKWFGKIHTKEREGDLIIEEKNRNRAIHEDEVYFEVIQSKQNSEKVYCKVVAILPWKKNNKRQIVGKIEYSYGNKTYYLVPINKRIISFNIKFNQIPKQLLKDRNNKYYLAEFTEWNDNEQYPWCKIIQEYGKIGQIQTEVNALLVTHGVHDEDYKEETIEKGLKKFIERIDETGEYKIEESQIKKRIDLRTVDIFTIDPLTARDFDDALSIQYIGNEKNKNLYEIGVHIADASFFVEEGGLIDQEAKKKTTSVYLVHRVLPMLPRILCQTMCSLNPGLQRLTLSVWFKITEDGIVLPGSRYDRSVIKSKARFTYEQAQSIIEKKVKSQNDIEQGFGCLKEKDFNKIASDICLMNDLAMKIRSNRIQGGSLIIETCKKTFNLDENKFPISYTVKQRFSANFLVEEYMLLANQKVGQILTQNIGPNSLLRKHRFPGNKKIEKFQTFMKKIGQNIQVKKEVKIQEQLNEIMKDPRIKRSIKQTLNYELIFLLQMAEYFLVGDTPSEEWIHYALNMPIYTHFTSPIRRYPDIMVHRQIVAILQVQKNGGKIKLPHYQNSKMLIQRCNRNKLTAKRVSGGCEKIFFCLYLKKNPVTCKAILTDVNEWGFNISIPQYDFRNTIELKELKKVKMIKFAKDSKERKYMEVECEYEAGEKTNLVLKEIQQISVRLSAKESFPLDYMIRLVFPHPKNPTNMIVYD